MAMEGLAVARNLSITASHPPEPGFLEPLALRRSRLLGIGAYIAHGFLVQLNQSRQLQPSFGLGLFINGMAAGQSIADTEVTGIDIK